MCLLLVRKAGGTLTRKQLKMGWDNNPDGAGIMYAKDGKIVIEKNNKSFKAFYEMYQYHNNNQDMVIHFRYGNKGTMSLKNVHPQRINEDMAFAHNGTVQDMPYHKLKSDTVLFNERVLQTLPEGWEKFQGIRRMMKEYIGQSKLVFLRSDGKIFFCNEAKGHWSKNKLVWYSNNSYKTNRMSVGALTGNPYANGYTNNSYYEPLTGKTTKKPKKIEAVSEPASDVFHIEDYCTECHLELIEDEKVNCGLCKARAEGYSAYEELLQQDN